MLKSHWIWLVGGIVLGISAGLNLAGIWPQVPVHAVATHGQENFAIATGMISMNVEAVYTLDFVTGDLKAAVLNLQNGKFMSFYEYNIARDFGPAGLKNPHYVMVTGVADLRRGGGQGQIGSTVLYVAEFNSGQVMAYALPWTTGRENVAVPFNGQFLPLDRLPFRNTPIRQ